MAKDRIPRASRPRTSSTHAALQTYPCNAYICKCKLLDCLSVRPSMSVRPSVHPSVRPCLSVRPSVRPSVQRVCRLAGPPRTATHPPPMGRGRQPRQRRRGGERCRRRSWGRRRGRLRRPAPGVPCARLGTVLVRTRRTGRLPGCFCTGPDAIVVCSQPAGQRTIRKASQARPGQA